MKSWFKSGKKVRKGRRAPLRRRAGKNAVVRSKATFAGRVKRVMRNSSETKTLIYTAPVATFNQQMNSTADCLRLYPAMSGGFDENQRVGNSITIKTLNIRGVLTFATGQPSIDNCRVGVRLLILRAKRFADWQQTATDFSGNYTKLLEGISTGFDGTLINYNAPINTDYFSCVKDMRWTFTQSQIAGGASPGQVMVNNTTKFINFNVPYTTGRKVQYDKDFNATEPLNFPYVMCLGWTMLNGSAPGANTYLTCEYVAKLNYNDF